MQDMVGFTRLARCFGAWSRLAAAAALCVALAAPAWGQAALRLDDFSKTLDANEAPEGWEARKFAPVFGSGDRFFYQFVHKSAEEHYIHLASGKNNSFSVGYRKEIRLQEYPILEWEWKVTRLPKGGSVQVKARDDQAGSMCVIVDPGLTGFKSFCYLWVNEGPLDTPITSKKRDDSKYLILHAGAEGLGTWHKEQRNILADYKRLFGEEPKEVAVVGMQIDSDDTESSGEAFYRNIFLRKP